MVSETCRGYMDVSTSCPDNCNHDRRHISPRLFNQIHRIATGGRYAGALILSRIEATELAKVAAIDITRDKAPISTFVRPAITLLNKEEVMGMRGGGDTPEKVFRKHIAAMRSYADMLTDNPSTRSQDIRNRIRECAVECEVALDRLRDKRYTGEEVYSYTEKDTTNKQEASDG